MKIGQKISHVLDESGKALPGPPQEQGAPRGLAPLRQRATVARKAGNFGQLSQEPPARSSWKERIIETHEGATRMVLDAESPVLDEEFRIGLEPDTDPRRSPRTVHDASGS